VYQGNIVRFNAYANTTDGLERHYQLTENVALPELSRMPSNWSPVGTEANPFTGSFDGGGFTLSGLTLIATDLENQGFFGVVDAGAEIKNCMLTGINIRITGADSFAIGGVAGLNRGTIKDCYVTGMVVGNGDVGGVVGANDGNVLDCHSTVRVSGDTAIGGVVGVNFGSVRGCHSEGNVSGNIYYVGGVVGINYGGVKACHSKGNVRSNGYVGGVVGWNESGAVVEACHATGDVTGFGFAGVVGGVVGFNIGTLQNCYATGRIAGIGVVGVVGGVVGSNEYNATVEHCYSTGDVTGDEAVGGVAGFNSGTLQHCYATGSVEGNDSVGGIAGGNSSGGGVYGRQPAKIENCVALSPSVKATSGTDVGRVTISGVLDSLSGNHAFIGILNNEGNTTWLNQGITNLDGEGKTAAEPAGFPERFASSPWTYEEGRLPGLFGQTMDMPVHLQ
jgi:hypothetical protein